jgi:NAD+ kinase
MKIALTGNTQKPKIRQVIREFVRHLERHRIEIVYSKELADFLALPKKAQVIAPEQIGCNCDMVVAFGGDGTILSTAGYVAKSGVPILGVNIGGLGFLAEVMVAELQETVDDLVNGRFAIIERMVLQVVMHQDGKDQSFSALNDVVVDKGASPRLMLIDVSVDNVFLNTYRCDGLIVATPTGSTAYSLSAGGPLLVPTMQAMIVTPICPHSLTVRPIVLSGDNKLKISIKKRQNPAILNIDGQSRCQLNPEDWVEIQKSDHTVKWVSIGKRDFFEIIRRKLNWGLDPTILSRFENREGGATSG